MLMLDDVKAAGKRHLLDGLLERGQGSTLTTSALE